VAHRHEILQQSQAIYRAVLRDQDFGERLGGGAEPITGAHVFANVQSLDEARVAALDPAAYDVVVVDEFHHAAAFTYERVLDRLRPKILLGLTATPERADGQSVLRWFDDRIAAELRLWKALDQDLLCPFQYFGVRDGTSLAQVTWTPRGYAIEELRRIYTAGDAWLRHVLEAVRHYVTSPGTMRALGFCVDIDHAEFMAMRFTEAGLPSLAVSQRTPAAARASALADLRDGRVRRASPPDADRGDPAQRMLFVLLGWAREPLAKLADAWRALFHAESLRDELRQLLAILDDRRGLTHPLEGRLHHVPLAVHGTYTLDEILAALGEEDANGGVRRLREGVFFSEKHAVDLLFVTLEKREGDYSPTTLYRDYPISPTRFHWESQSQVHAAMKTGRRYVSHAKEGSDVWLFVRRTKSLRPGITAPYTFVGPSTYAHHEGGRPMAIEWQLARPMPAWLYQETKLAAGWRARPGPRARDESPPRAWYSFGSGRDGPPGG
jgi:Domain of unknown function (DUF3427)/Type III restriction enzyme, res subunit